MSRNLINDFLEYLEHEKKYSNHTVVAYRRDLIDFQDYCKDEFEEADLKEIHYNQIRNWVVLLIDKDLTNRTVNRKISSLKTFYNFLQKIEEIKINPLAKHKSLKVQKKLSIPFTDKEVHEVIELLQVKNDFEGVRDRLVVELLYSTGIRRAELIHIKESDINFEERLLKVLGKRNKERFVVLLPFVITTIRKYQEEKKKLEILADDHYLLITKNGVKIYETLVYRIINSYFREVSTKVKKSPHILRHAFATHLLNNGASLYSVKELLGHSSLASTQVYTHSSLEELKQVYNKTHPRELK